MISLRLVRLILMTLAGCLLVGACATVPDDGDWIAIGQTTRQDVVKRYGEPDLVIVEGDGEIATYRPRHMAPRAEIPTIQAGPLGTATTKMEPVNTGSGPPNGGAQNRPAHELQIRYDARGVVRDIVR